MGIKRMLLLMGIIGLGWSCKKDDGPQATIVPPRSLSEVATENHTDIVAYLKTHFYNYEEFKTPAADFDYRIKIDTIAGDNAGKTPLMDQVDSEIIMLSADDLGLDQTESDVPHTLYYLNAPNTGTGENPTIVDSLYLRYEGSRLDGTVFDSRLGAPVWLDLQGTLTQANPGTIRGFKKGLPKFKSGGNIVVNDDGTFNVEGFGVGAIFMPSALAYFSGTQPGLAYAPLIFKIELLVAVTADHDRDGVPTFREDLNGNENLFDDNTDEDGLPDYLDPDDDGDEIPTLDEIKDGEGNIVFPYPDTNNNGTPDYLESNN